MPRYINTSDLTARTRYFEKVAVIGGQESYETYPPWHKPILFHGEIQVLQKFRIVRSFCLWLE